MRCSCGSSSGAASTHAAEDLRLARAAVTDAIKALEARRGVRLLQRTSRQVVPTLEGEIYYVVGFHSSAPAVCCRWSSSAKAGRASRRCLRARVAGADACLAAACAGPGIIQAPR